MVTAVQTTPSIVPAASDLSLENPVASSARGVEIRSLHSHPDLARRAAEAFDLPAEIALSTRIFLAPDTTTHPILSAATPLRCLMDGRAYSEAVRFRSGGQGTLVYKGAALVSEDAVAGYGTYLTLGVFPGSMVQRSATSAFEAGCLLQIESQRRFNAFGPTLVPLSVREILSIGQDGEQLPVREFIDRNVPRAVFERNPRTRTFSGTPSEFLFDKHGVRPCQFLYVLEGSPVKVAEVHDLIANPEESLRHRLASRLLPGLAPALVTCLAYRHLVDAYGYANELKFEELDAFGNSPADCAHAIKAQLSSSGLGAHIFDTFLARTTSMAALGHSLRQSFSDREIVYNGCLHFSNTTVGGIVVDLDNVHTERWYDMSNSFYRKDVDELRETAVTFAGLLGNWPADQIAAAATDRYAKRMAEFSE